ncbi:MAG: tetratricopeptide repeat protein [Bacteroidetes bacterium]|nr:MAG: tetratricopeptide repeat protein [Bacteroidota bacterium]MBL1144611.1 tetratricopeptide repeat protein [Bacteroidota bacterium]MCB0802297.1 tetratricopeptide repeat protein [Flavobacteriales bacterium]NOG57406.1 tetratricopeptide repeat protein [Bacteroidota bacterium]
MKLKSLLILVALFLSYNFGYSQSHPAEVKLEKVNALLKKNKIDAADKKLVLLLEEYPSYGYAWDLLAKIRYYQYNESKKIPNIFDNVSIETTDSSGNKIENDSLTLNLMNLFAQLSPEKKAYNNYLYTLRQAMLYSDNAYKSSMYLRIALRDFEVDTALGSKELKYFDKAEDEFKANNYNNAAKYYQRAIDINPSFYKALLYLGDSYYSLGNYIEAIKKFKICTERYPNLLEPHKYLVDAYYHEGLYEKALQTSIQCLTIYPDLSIFQKLEDAAFKLNKKTSFLWMRRETFPNINNEDSLFVVDEDKQPKISASPYWDIYNAAIEKVKPFSSKDGIIEEGNEFAPYVYLELYGWEQMLKESEHESLDLAKKMKALDYLDCYVFLSCFHDDLYSQYQHFVKNNKEKITAYFNDVVLEDM